MQYGTRKMIELYIKHKDDNTYYNHTYIRSDNPMTAPEKFIEQQKNASIDTLTNTLKSIQTELTHLETSLRVKQEEHDVVRGTLQNKLEVGLNAVKTTSNQWSNIINPKDNLTPTERKLVELNEAP